MQDPKQLLTRYMNGDLTEVEIDMLYEYYDKESLDKLREETSKYSIEVKDVNVQYSDFIRRSKEKDKPTHRLLAKSLMILLVFSFIAFGLIKYLTQKTKVSNDTNSPMHYAMSDGVEIKLAPGATISFDKSKYKTEREIDLFGRAHFDVKKPGPFTVYAEDEVKISVLGTQFDVWPYKSKDGSHVNVTCYEGEVRVVQKNNSIDLSESEKVITGSSDWKKYQIYSNKVDWLNGNIKYMNVSLSAVHGELESYYGVRFKGDIRQDNFSGVLPLTDLQAALNILGAVTSDTYHMQGTTIEITPK